MLHTKYVHVYVYYKIYKCVWFSSMTLEEHLWKSPPPQKKKHTHTHRHMFFWSQIEILQLFMNPGETQVSDQYGPGLPFI